MQYLLTLIGLLIGALGFNYLKRKSAEALLENNDVKSKLNEQDTNKAANDGRLETEEEKRKADEIEAIVGKNRPVDPKDFN